MENQVDDELEQEEVQQENTQALQQQQLEDSLASTRPRLAYKQVLKLGANQPLKHYG